MLVLSALATALGAPATVRAAPPIHRTERAATVTGTVTDEATHQPILGAQIFVLGSTVGAQTDAQGRYRLVNVPAGPVRLRAKRIGYASSDRDVTLADGATATVDFAL